MKLNAMSGRRAAPMPVRPRKPRQPLSARVPDLVLVLLGVGGALLSGWSLTTLMMEAGAPWWVAGLALTVLDGLALLAGVMVYLRRHAPHTAAGAQLVLLLAVLASAVVNAAHGYMMEGGGWMAAVVLGAAPLAWETGFALRHRTLTELIWMWWGKEARTALRREAWERIAPITESAVTVHREERAEPDVAELAVDDADPRPVTPIESARERLTVAMARQRAIEATPGATAEDHARARRALEEAVREFVTAPTGGSAPRREVPETPAETVSAQVSAADAAGDLRPEPPETPEPEPDHGRGIESRPSLRAAVHTLYGLGVTEPEEIGRRLTAVLGTPPSPASVERYVREARSAGASAKRPETGPMRRGYL